MWLPIGILVASTLACVMKVCIGMELHDSMFKPVAGAWAIESRLY